MIYIYEKNNRKRPAEERVCGQCGKLFLARVGRATLYCSRICHTLKIKSNRLPTTCAYCSKSLRITKAKYYSSKNKKFFCNRDCKDKGQSIEGGVKEIQPPHYKNGLCSYKNKFKTNNKNLKCTRCGYHEYQECVEIHHIDRNRENNFISNLIPLCCNCHRALHYNLINLNDIISS